MNTTDRPLFRTQASCRISDSPNLIDILSLGDQPLANSLKDDPAAPEMKVPLTLAFCPESSLLQIKETVAKEVLFSNYVWVSGTGAATRDFAKQFAAKIVKLGTLDPKDLIVEIASNDGTFLKPFVEMGFKNVLGVDPAANIAEMARRDGIRTLTRFWNQEVAQEISKQDGKAKIIFARNVIPHVSDLQDVMAGIAFQLRDDGMGAIEFHYARDIHEGLQYDATYHEHLCYFSIASIDYLLKRHNLFLFDAELGPLSGGALVVYFSKTRRTPTESLERLRAEELQTRIDQIETWQQFAKKCLEHKRRSADLLSSFPGKTVVGFGASARSSTYLNFCGFNHSHIRAMIDNNPLKQGKFTPGSSIPIVPFEAGLAMKPDLLFLFAWNFQDEIMKRCKSAGYQGKFLTAFPNEPRVQG